MLARIWGTLVVAVVVLGLIGCGDDKSGGGGGGGKSGGGKKKQEEIAAGGWGDLKITFVYGGTRPTPQPVDMGNNADAPYCIKHNPVDESLVVGPEGQLANVVVYLRSSDAPVHASYTEQEGQEVKLVNKGCRFEPHVAKVWTRQKLVLTNEDKMNHNSKAHFVKNDIKFNPIIQPKGSSPYEFSKSETVPIEIACNLHPWMKAHVLVRDNPYMGVSGPDGVLVIKNLPTGNWEFIIWHERPGYVTDAKRNGKSEVWTRGRVKLAIKPDVENDLGTVEIAAELLKKK